MDQERASLRLGTALARLAWGLVTAVAILVTFVDTAGRGHVNPFNFFGYFTIQSNSMLAVVAIAAGLLGLLRPGLEPRWLLPARALVTMCMVIVGVVYAVLLAPLGAAGGVPVPWANWVMHIAGPLLVVVDWAFVREPRALPWRVAWLLLLYPAVWVAVVLVRGATDGWVPYPFLRPDQGYGVVSIYVLVIALAFAAVSFAVVGWSRTRARAKASR